VKLTLTLVVLLLAAGCAENGKDKSKAAVSHESSKPAKRYATQDIAWLKKLVRWETRYSAARARADDAYWAFIDGKKGLGSYRSALRPMRNCARGLQTDLREPRADRLHRAFRLLLAACEQERQLAVAKAGAYAPAGKRRPATDEAEKNGEKLIRRAHQIIRVGLLANRPLPVAGGMTKKSRIEPRFSRAAGRLALRRVEVRCWSPRDWKATVREYETYTGRKAEIAGFANPSARANIIPRSCADLARFTYKHWRPGGGVDLARAADAVELIAHETEHLVNQSASEAETECHGVQDVRRLARLLGASPSYSARLATVYWKALYPANPEAYRTRDCRNDGPLDLNPESDVWP
jgi:hypothetical protein